MWRRTDSPLVAPGISLHTNLRAAGMAYSNVQALRNVTVNAAPMAFVDADLSTVQVGKVADLTIVRGDPLADLKNAANVEYVMKNGTTCSMAQSLRRSGRRKLWRHGARVFWRTNARASVRACARLAPTRPDRYAVPRGAVRAPRHVTADGHDWAAKDCLAAVNFGKWAPGLGRKPVLTLCESGHRTPQRPPCC